MLKIADHPSCSSFGTDKKKYTQLSINLNRKHYSSKSEDFCDYISIWIVMHE